MNTPEGLELFEHINADFSLKVTVDAVMAENGGFAESLPVPEKRAEFFEGLKVIGVDVYKHMSRYIVRKPLSYRMWTRIRSMLSSIKRRVVK